MSTTTYVITETTLLADSISADDHLVRQTMPDPRRVSAPVRYDTLEEAQAHLDYIRASANLAKGHSVLDTFSTPVAVTVFYTNGDIRVVRVVPFTTEILSAVKVEEA